MTRYDVLINPRREDRRRLGGLREVKFQVDTGDPWAQEHYGENAEQIGAAIAADYPDSSIIVESTDDPQDVCRRGYVIDLDEGGSLYDDANGWPPTWFVHRAMEEGLSGRDFEEYLIDLLPEGWGYDIAEDRALTFRLRCPHGHDRCHGGSGSGTSTSEWRTSQRRVGWSESALPRPHRAGTHGLRFKRSEKSSGRMAGRDF
jgi:hypothetical protein